MEETWIQSLGQESHLDQKMAAYFSILAWRILWTEEPGGLESLSSRVRHDWTIDTFIFSFIGASLVTQMVNNLLSVQETRFSSWVWKITWRRELEFSLLLFSVEFPWAEEPGGLQSMGSQRVRYNWVTNTINIGRNDWRTKISWIIWKMVMSGIYFFKDEMFITS